MPFLPDITTGVSYSQSGSSKTGSPEESYGASLTISQNIFNGFQDLNTWRRSVTQSRIGKAQFKSLLAQLSYELKAAYQGLNYALEYQRLTTEIVRRRDAHFRMVDLRFRGGRENKGSALLASANLKEARFENFQAKNQVEAAEGELKRTLGLEDDENLEIRGLLPRADIQVEPNLNQIIPNTPDLEIAKAQEDYAELSKEIAKGVFYPTLSISGTLGNSGPWFFPEKDSWSVGASLVFSLSAFYKNSPNYGITQANRSSAYFARKSIEKRLRLKLKDSYRKVIESVEKAEVDESYRDAALIRADISRSKYSKGVSTFSDWEQIENDLIDRQKKFLLSQKNRELAVAQWEADQGHGAFDGAFAGGFDGGFDDEIGVRK